MDKRKEFWISLGEECDDMVWHTHPKNEHFNFHTVEIKPHEKVFSYEDIAGAFARAYCTKENEKKELDSMIGIAMLKELFEGEG